MLLEHQNNKFINFLAIILDDTHDIFQKGHAIQIAANDKLINFYESIPTTIFNAF